MLSAWRTPKNSCHTSVGMVWRNTFRIGSGYLRHYQWPRLQRLGAPATDHLILAQYHSDDLRATECKRQRTTRYLFVSDLPIRYGLSSDWTKRHPLFTADTIKFLHHVQAAYVLVILYWHKDGSRRSAISAKICLYSMRIATNWLIWWKLAVTFSWCHPCVWTSWFMNQMYVVWHMAHCSSSAVGGLKDTVIDYDQNPAQATGFVFEEPEPYPLNVLLRALLLYVQDPCEFRRVQHNAMLTRYLWSDSVHSYEDMYRKALGWQWLIDEKQSNSTRSSVFLLPDSWRSQESVECRPDAKVADW